MPKLSEWHIYGNEQQGRFSVRKPDYDPITDPLYYLDVLKSDVTIKNFFRILDKKQYELKDHLGNVRVAIGDMKIPTGIRGIAPFVVDEKSVSDFYPGGMSISDRSWQGTSYRYGYNAQEKSLEIDASGNHHTAEFWEVNNASLRRWNRDPKPIFGLSDYSIFGNNSIRYNDLNGDSVDLANLYSKDKEGNLNYPEQVESFERFAATKEGRNYILERAQQGFELKGVIVKDLHIKAEKEGVFSKEGIDVSLMIDDLNEHIPKYHHQPSAADAHTDGWIKENGRLQLNFILDYRTFYSEFEQLKYIDSWIHEFWYHGFLREKEFLKNGSPGNGVSSHSDFFNKPSIYSLHSNELLYKIAKNLNLNINKNRIQNEIQDPGFNIVRKKNK